MSNEKTYKIGDSAHGGIVFSVDETGQHGLVTANRDLGDYMTWQKAMDEVKDGYWFDEEAKKYSDWRLPTRDELNLIYENLHVKNLTPQTMYGMFQSEYYWSSTESLEDRAWKQNFHDGTQNGHEKTDMACARAVRVF